MDVVYGVGVANRFAFLNDEEEDEETVLLATINSPEVQKKKGLKEKVEASKLIPKKQSNVANEVKSSSSKKEITRGGGSKGQGQRKERRERENDAESRPQRRPQVSNRDGPPSQRRFRGRMTSPENKKADDDAEGEKTEENAENQSNNVDDGADADKEGVKEEGELAEENEVEQVPTITLKEWKAMQAPREKPVFNIRKPGEGEDPRFLEKFVLKKKENNEDVVNEDAGDYEDEMASCPQRAGKTKQIADVGFTTGYQRRRIGRGGGGGRGRYGGGDAQDEIIPENNGFGENVRGRRRGDKHGVQYQRRPVPVPRFDDTRDFPSLG